MAIVHFHGRRLRGWHIPLELRKCIAFLGYQISHADFIANNLDGGGKVEGTVVRVSRNMDVIVTFVEFFVAEPTIFTTKYHRDLMVGRLGPNTLAAFTWIKQWPRNTTFARTGPNDQAATRDGFIKRFNYNGIIKYIGCASGTPYRFIRWEILRGNEIETR